MDKDRTISVNGSAAKDTDDAAEFAASQEITDESVGDGGLEDFNSIPLDGDNVKPRKVADDDADEGDDDENIGEDGEPAEPEPEAEPEAEPEPEPEPQPKPKAKAPAKQPEPQSEAPFIDAAALEEFSDIIGENAFNKVVKPLVEAAETVKKLEAENQRLRDEINETTYTRMVNDRIDRIGDPKYGTDWTDLTPAQEKARAELRVVAESIYEKAQKAKAPIKGGRALVLAAKQLAEGKTTAARGQVLTRTDKAGNKVQGRATSQVNSRPTGSSPAPKSYASAARSIDRKLANLGD